MDTNFMAFGNHLPLFFRVQHRSHCGNIEGGRNIIFFEQFQNTGHTDAGAIFTPSHPPDRFSAIAQFIGFMIGIEGQSKSTACAILPASGPVGASRTHLIHQFAPMRFRPLPRFHCCCGHEWFSFKNVTGSKWRSCYRQGLACNERGVVRGKKQCRIRNIFRLPHPADCNGFGKIGAGFIRIAVPLPDIIGAGRHKTRSHRIDGNAELAQLVG